MENYDVTEDLVTQDNVTQTDVAYNMFSPDKVSGGGSDIDNLEGGYFYKNTGEYLDKIGNSENVYVADNIEEKTRSLKDKNGNEIKDDKGKLKTEKYKVPINPISLNIKHKLYQRISNVVLQEGLSTTYDEYLWIAHTNNNNAKKKNITFSSLILSSYSSVKDKSELSDKMKISRANFARAAVISVLIGSKDPTGGAMLWDGADFLAWGLNSPNGTPQNKLEEYKTIYISKNVFEVFLFATKSSYPNGYNYFTGKYDKNKNKIYFHSDIPDNVFTDAVNFDSSGNFDYTTKSKSRKGLRATGTAGGSIFWKII
jgi:hypothetical protein